MAAALNVKKTFIFDQAQTAEPAPEENKRFPANLFLYYTDRKFPDHVPGLYMTANVCLIFLAYFSILPI